MNIQQLAHVVSFGPICTVDEESGLVITVNGAYLNAWWVRDDCEPDNFDCRAMDDTLYNTTGAKMIDLADDYANDILQGLRDEDEES